jgi:hypothetical protein
MGMSEIGNQKLNLNQNEYKFSTLKYINIILGILSILSCLIVIFTFLIFKKIRSFILELVIYLSISSLFQTVSSIIYFPENQLESDNKLCQFQAFGMELFALSQFLWTSLISFSIFQSVIYLKNYTLKNPKLNFIRLIFLLIAFGIPFIISLIGLIFKVYGVAGFWCFIDMDEINKNKDNKYLIFYSFTFCFLWICIIFNVIMYTCVYKYLKSSLDENEENRIKNYTRPLMIYSIIQIFCLFPTTIIRFYQLFNNDYLDSLNYIQSICDVSQGFFYSLAYGFNPIVKRTIVSFFRKSPNTDLNNNNDIDNDQETVLYRKISITSGNKSNLDRSNISFLDIN